MSNSAKPAPLPVGDDYRRMQGCLAAAVEAMAQATKAMDAWQAGEDPPEPLGCPQAIIRELSEPESDGPPLWVKLFVFADGKRGGEVWYRRHPGDGICARCGQQVPKSPLGNQVMA